MKIDVEEISSVKKAITVEVPEEIVTKEFQSAYSDLNRRVRIPGFRPGKAPRALLEKRYAQAVQDDVIRKLVPDYCQRAIKEAQISPVELPAIENVQLKENTPLKFKATVEIKPSVELKDYLGLRIKTTPETLKEEDVARTLESLRQKHAMLEAYPSDHSAQDGDFALIDFEGTIDSQSFEGNSGKGIMVQIGSHNLVAGFEEQLIGRKAGDTAEVRITFPKGYSKKELVDKSAVFQVTLREIKKQIIPHLDDEFAKDLGEFSSLEELKSKVRTDLKAQLEKEEKRAKKQALMKELVEAHPIDLPPSMVDREMRSMLSQLQARLPEGTTLDQAKIGPEFVKNELEPAAQEKVKGWLILDAIADREGIEVSKKEVDDALANMGQEMRVPVEDLRRLIISREGSLDGFSQRLRQDQALDLVSSKTVYESS